MKTKVEQKAINSILLSTEYQEFPSQTFSQTFPQSIVVDNFF